MRIPSVLVRISAAGAVSAGLALGSVGNAAALTLSSARDCNSNAVIKCGSLSTTELQKDYQNSSYAQAVYNYFGITAKDIKSIDQTAVAGVVTSDNTVKVNGKTVATNALTAGRDNMSGSKKTTNGGATFFVRPPQVSFQSKQLSAFVVLGSNNRFEYAIIASCDNPVIGKTPRQPTQPAPKPTPKPQPKPTPTQPHSTPPQTPPATSTSSPQQQLPSTGPGLVPVGVFGGGTVLGTTYRYLRLRRRGR